MSDKKFKRVCPECHRYYYFCECDGLSIMQRNKQKYQPSVAVHAMSEEEIRIVDEAMDEVSDELAW